MRRGLHSLFEWFAGLPRGVQYAVSLTILGVAAYELTQGRFWPLAWGIGGVWLMFTMLLHD